MFKQQIHLLPTQGQSKKVFYNITPSKFLPLVTKEVSNTCMISNTELSVNHSAVVVLNSPSQRGSVIGWSWPDEWDTVEPVWGWTDNVVWGADSSHTHSGSARLEFVDCSRNILSAQRLQSQNTHSLWAANTVTVPCHCFSSYETIENTVQARLHFTHHAKPGSTKKIFSAHRERRWIVLFSQ